MSNCIICDFPAKPSHAEDWPVPFKVCCYACLRSYHDEQNEVEDDDEKEDDDTG